MSKDTFNIGKKYFEGLNKTVYLPLEIEWIMKTSSQFQ